MELENQRLVKFSRKLSLFTDPIRLKLFFFLFSAKAKDLCVSAIASQLESSISNTSHQLRKLEFAGIIEPVRDGRKICYRVRKTKENITLYSNLKKLILSW